LFDHVADHAVRLGAEDVERVGLESIRRGLERKHADLGSVAVGKDELVLPRNRGQGLGRHPHVDALVLGRHGLATAQQGVAAQGDYDPHPNFIRKVYSLTLLN
jgi:hypothetical protein